jgi:transposase
MRGEDHQTDQLFRYVSPEDVGAGGPSAASDPPADERSYGSLVHGDLDPPKVPRSSLDQNDPKNLGVIIAVGALSPLFMARNMRNIEQNTELTERIVRMTAFLERDSLRLTPTMGDSGPGRISDPRCWVGWRSALMPRPYSVDLRDRVVSARRSRMSKLETAQLYDVSPSSVQRWSRLDRETGCVAAKPMGGNRRFVLASEREWVLERIAKRPDLPLRALLAELHDRGITVSYFVVWNIVDRAGLSFKKACTPANRTGRTSHVEPAMETAAG